MFVRRNLRQLEPLRHNIYAYSPYEMSPTTSPKHHKRNEALVSGVDAAKGIISMTIIAIHSQPHHGSDDQTRHAICLGVYEDGGVVCGYWAMRISAQQRYHFRKSQIKA